MMITHTLHSRREYTSFFLFSDDTNLIFMEVLTNITYDFWYLFKYVLNKETRWCYGIILLFMQCSFGPCERNCFIFVLSHGDTLYIKTSPFLSIHVGGMYRKYIVVCIFLYLYVACTYIYTYIQNMYMHCLGIVQYMILYCIVVFY